MYTVSHASIFACVDVLATSECPQVSRDQLPPELRGDFAEKRDEQGQEENEYRVEVIVGARKKEEVSMQVTAGVVKWTLSVLAHGIKFSAALRPEVGQEIELRKVDQDEKIKGEMGLIRGSWLLSVEGLLVMTLDNTYSRFRSKTVKLAVSFEPSCSPDINGLDAAVEAMSLTT